MFKGHNFAALRIPLSLRGHVSWNICVCVCDTPHSTTVQMQDRKKWKNGKCAEAHKTKKTGQVELFLFAELFLFLSSQCWTTYPLPVFHTISVCLDCSPSVCLIALQLSRKETCLKCAAYSVPDRIIPVLVWFYSRRVLLFFFFFTTNQEMMIWLASLKWLYLYITHVSSDIAKNNVTGIDSASPLDFMELRRHKMTQYVCAEACTQENIVITQWFNILHTQGSAWSEASLINLLVWESGQRKSNATGLNSWILWYTEKAAQNDWVGRYHYSWLFIHFYQNIPLTVFLIMTISPFYVTNRHLVNCQLKNIDGWSLKKVTNVTVVLWILDRGFR